MTKFQATGTVSKAQTSYWIIKQFEFQVEATSAQTLIHLPLYVPSSFWNSFQFTEVILEHGMCQARSIFKIHLSAWNKHISKHIYCGTRSTVTRKRTSCVRQLGFEILILRVWSSMYLHCMYCILTEPSAVRLSVRLLRLSWFQFPYWSMLEKIKVDLIQHFNYSRVPNVIPFSIRFTVSMTKSYLMSLPSDEYMIKNFKRGMQS